MEKLKIVQCSDRNPKEPGRYKTNLGESYFNGKTWAVEAAQGIPTLWYDKVKPRKRIVKKVE